MVRALIRRLVPDQLASWVRERRVVQIEAGVARGLRLVPHRCSGDYQGGENELPVQHALRDHLKAGDVLYDVGANVGFFSLIGARLVGPTGKVLGFEPVAENVNVARRNFELNHFRNVSILQKAVSNRAGHADLVLATHPGGATLRTDQAPVDATTTISVELIPLDTCVFELGFPAPTFVKIDVEGAEMAVLEGMTRVLREAKPHVLYEIDDQAGATIEEEAERFEAFLAEHGYRVTRLKSSYDDAVWVVRHFLATPNAS